MRLKSKNALITGAGGPMGGAIAHKYAAQGADLILTDISGTRLKNTADKLRDEFPDRTIKDMRASVIARDEAQALADFALASFGRVDILVNVVGGIRSAQLYTPFLELSEEQWDETFALNLKGGFFLMQHLVPGMQTREYGKIINISSVVFSGEVGQVDYAAAKAAVASMTRSLAEEFAPHINVNCIAPGVIRTSVTERMSDEDISRMTAKSFIQRLGEAGEIADAAAFLASDEAAFVTGEILAVSGGNHPGL